MMGCMMQAAILTCVVCSAMNALKRGKVLPELIAIYLAFQAIALFLQMSPHLSLSACAKATQHRCDTARKRCDVTPAIAWALLALGWPLLCHALDEARDPLLVQAKYAQIVNAEREGKVAAEILSTVSGVITAILHITTTERHCLATLIILLNVRLAQQAYTLASDDAGDFMMQQSLDVAMGYVVGPSSALRLPLITREGGLSAILCRRNLTLMPTAQRRAGTPACQRLPHRVLKTSSALLRTPRPRGVLLGL